MHKIPQNRIYTIIYTIYERYVKFPHY